MPCRRPEGGQGLVRELCSAGEELFMDSHQIPLATGEQLQDLLPVGLGLSRGGGVPAPGGIRTQNLADRETERPSTRAIWRLLTLGCSVPEWWSVGMGSTSGSSSSGMRSAKRFSCWRRCRSARVRPGVADDPSRRLPPRPVASGRGSKSRSPCPDRAAGRRPRRGESAVRRAAGF